ncbi:MAG: glycoside hydrolase family 10 protein [Armatimonadota bacterium]
MVQSQLWKITFSVATITLMAGAVARAELDFVKVDPVYEIRGIWLDAGSIPKQPGAIRHLISKYRRANINVIFPEVICRGYAVYPSNLLPRDPRFASSPDPLPTLIKEAHKAGIEVHAWAWVFRAGYSKDKGGILTAHPEWIELGSNGLDLSPNGGFWISPASKDARQYLAECIEELVTRYELDGLHLDYIRYEDETKVPYGYSRYSQELFKHQYCTDAPKESASSDWIHIYEWRKFRERLINTFVQEIALRVRRIKTHVKLSSAVVPDLDIARKNYMQNWVHWIDNKWLDFVVPMAYDSDNEHFRRVLLKLKAAAGKKTLLAAGIGSFTLRSENQFEAQIGITREVGTCGQVLFAAAYIKDHHIDRLASGAYSLPARLPFREPMQAVKHLLQYAAKCVEAGEFNLAEHFTEHAQNLLAYCHYMTTHAGYVPPTPPP